MFDFDQLNAFANGIRFRFIQPDDSGLALVTGDHVGIDIDLRNTILPERAGEFEETLGPLCRSVKRMSTFAIGSIINLAVSQMPADHCYVNVGVWNGFTLFCGMAGNEDKRCVGIDNFSQFGGPREAFLQQFNLLKSETSEFHEMDYRKYFDGMHSRKIGLYFYDGHHSEENQYLGLKIAEPYLSEDALILIDDTNNRGVIQGTNRYIRESRLKFRLVARFKTSHNFHPTFWNGLILMQRQA